MTRTGRRLTRVGLVAALLVAAAPGWASEKEPDADQAEDGVLQTRKLLDLQRGADTPTPGMTAPETRRILENYLESIGKGGAGAPLPDPPSQPQG